MRTRIFSPLAVALLCAGCAVSPDTMLPVHSQEARDPGDGGRESSSRKTRPRGDETRWGSKWNRDNIGKTVHLGLITGGPRFLVGGKFERVAEPVSYFQRISLAFNFPFGKKSAISPYALLQTYDVRVKHSEMFWRIGEVGGGLRYLFFHEGVGDLYVRTDGAFAYGDGGEDDTITHPGFDRTLFKQDDPNQFEPKDIRGYSLGIGVGADLFSYTNIGVALELGYRYQRMSEGFDSHSIEFLFVWSIRY